MVGNLVQWETPVCFHDGKTSLRQPYALTHYAQHTFNYESLTLQNNDSYKWKDGFVTYYELVNPTVST